MSLRKNSYDLILVFAKGVSPQVSADITAKIAGDGRLDQADGLDGQTLVGVSDGGKHLLKRVRATEQGLSGRAELRTLFWDYGAPVIKVREGQSGSHYVTAESIFVVAPA